MKQEQTDAIERLKVALTGHVRGTKFHRAGRVRGHLSGGKIVEVDAADVVQACAKAKSPSGCGKARELLHGATNALEHAKMANGGEPRAQEILVCTDDLFMLLDQCGVTWPDDVAADKNAGG